MWISARESKYSPVCWSGSFHYTETVHVKINKSFSLLC